MTTNPFFEPWTTPFGVPPFDRIRAADVPDALERGMREHLAEIEAIAASPELPTFANTIEALERAGALLERVGGVFSNLVSSLGTAEFEAIERDFAPRLARHGMEVALNPALFARVDALHAQRHALDLAPDALRLLERRHLGFVRNGAQLAPAQKERMSEISGLLATLHTRFGQNVVHDETEWHLPLAETDLDGLPDFAREGARQAAADRGLAGYAVTLARSSIEPFLTFSTRRDLRRTAYLAWLARGEHPGPHDNRPLIPEILGLRAERARLLGYATYAEFRLADTMAGTQANVARLTDQVWEAAKRRGGRGSATGCWAVARTEGFNGRDGALGLAATTPSSVRQAEFDARRGRAEAVLRAGATSSRRRSTPPARLFGLRFVARPDVPAYHPDMRAWEVRDADGHVGVFLADNFARAGKRSGAWMSSYRDQHALGGDVADGKGPDGPVSPIIVNNNNFARGTPTLLSFDDAQTLFHEFGHALHGLLSRVRYPSQSGTSVRRDFVEFPSQIYEHWLSVPDTLHRFARHHETGEPLPDALVGRLLSARNFNQGFATVEYTASAVLDMALHAHPDPAGLDVAAFEREVLGRMGMPRRDQRCATARRTSSTCSPAAATRPATTPTCGRRCWTPTGSAPSRRRATRSIRRRPRACARCWRRATRRTRWDCTWRSAASLRTPTRCSATAA